jgi:hypothetical protein
VRGPRGVVFVGGGVGSSLVDARPHQPDGAPLLAARAGPALTQPRYRASTADVCRAKILARDAAAQEEAIAGYSQFENRSCEGGGVGGRWCPANNTELRLWQSRPFRAPKH